MTTIVPYSPGPIAPITAAGPLIAEPTEALVSLPVNVWRWAGSGGSIARSIWFWYVEPQRISIQIALNEFAFERTFGKTIIENALLHALTARGRGTTTPQQICMFWDNELQAEPAARHRRKPWHHQTAAQVLLERVKSLSGLTLEEIAPLLGVSRRTLQNWRAQHQISARKEQRLRDLADLLDSISLGSADERRRKLLDRLPGNVRPYNLLAEGRFDAAYHMMTGSPAPDYLVARSAVASDAALSVPVLTGLSSRSDGPPLPSGRVDLARSKRLKR
jgi:Homeodomain-like domain